MTVMVWIHGGGYQTGQGMLYKSNYLSLRGNVIVVTINYRLNVFGFLSTGDSILPGNYGLWDQRLAIQWVKSHIAAFGGNPSAITIFGESAGGWSVGLQTLYPDNRGLFTRAIMESGVGNSFLAISSNCVVATKGVGNLLHCPSTDHQTLANCLRKVNASLVMQALDNYEKISFNANFTHFRLNFAPVIDNNFIKDDPVKLMTDVSSPSYEFYRSLDVIVGNMNAEGSILLGGKMPDYEKAFSFNIKEGIPNQFVCNIITPTIAKDFFSGKDDVSKAICNKYSAMDKSNLTEQGILAVDLYGDAFFVSPAVKALEIHSRDNMKTSTYQFMFTRKASFWLPGSLPSWFPGAGHATEILYLFDIQAYAAFDPLITAEDLKLSEIMLKYWSNFAKTGDPNSGSVPRWEEYSNQFVYQNLDYNITEKQQVFADRVKFWLLDLPNMTKL